MGMVTYHSLSAAVLAIVRIYGPICRRSIHRELRDMRSSLGFTYKSELLHGTLLYLEERRLIDMVDRNEYVALPSSVRAA